ncbi:glucooligosaccharide oxidase [Diaporthe helianthi]|uniref:Glucooligosaccharide oxidase n=1 Tax=Diaporthe helianthi TaxID=158607 RepID=A0A2P5HTW8_DIAHE|nr:glucooligosaccharide oxidase [Diaporthe helianthi]
MKSLSAFIAIWLFTQHDGATFPPSTASLSTRQTGLLDCLYNNSVPRTVSTSANWTEFVISYNIRLQYDPAVIIIPETTQQVSDSVVCASLNGINVQAKSGGHSYASTSSGGKDGSMVVDLQRFHDVTVDEATGIASVGAGARLGNMALTLNEKGRALAHGTCAGVGVGGHFTLGGYGYTSRAWGMALDQIVGLDVVKADGEFVHASAEENPDLYYVMRGAAPSFGIATTLYLQTQPAPAVTTYFGFSFPGAAPATSIDTAVSSFMHLQDMAQNASVTTRNLSFGITLGTHGFQVRGVYLGSASDFNDRISPELLRGLPQPSSPVAVQELDWRGNLELLNGGGLAVSTAEPYTARDNFFAKSVAVPEPGFSDAALRSYITYIANQGASPPAPVRWFAIINLDGGVDSQINARGSAFSAYGHRNLMWTVQNYGFVGAGNAFPESGIGFMNGLNGALTDVLDGEGAQYGAYINYADPTLGADQANRLYYGDELVSKLKGLKAALDPGNVFAHPQSIFPSD